ncbi:MAG: hypothetical protein K8R92_11875 [Planctomycetes bacterium]|nr:hypothetical protein [Planctomycetota bacterium]
MTIHTQDPVRLELRGVPQGLSNLLGGFLVLGAMLGGVAYFWMEFPDWATRLVLGFGALFLLFILGLMTDALLQRERLVLDAGISKGEYLRRSLVRGQLEQHEFALVGNTSVELETYFSGGMKNSKPRKCLRANLLITQPDKAIILDYTVNGREQRVRALAAAVAEFLGQTPIQSGESGEI